MAGSRYSVDQLSDGEILVRGTEDPVDALRIAVERLDELPRLEYVIDGAMGEHAENPVQEGREIGEYLNRMLDSVSGIRWWRKVNSLPNSEGEANGWCWTLYPAEPHTQGAFRAVQFGL